MDDATRETLRGISGTTFSSWMHHPVTKLMWTFMADRRDALRLVAADIVEEGTWDTDSPSDANPYTLRGRLSELQDLLRIELAHIRGFYGEETPPEEADDEGNGASAPEGGPG